MDIAIQSPSPSPSALALTPLPCLLDFYFSLPHLRCQLLLLVVVESTFAKSLGHRGL